MKPELTFHATTNDAFAVLAIADADDPGAMAHYFAKVLEPQVAQQSNVDPFTGLVSGAPAEPPELTDHVALPGTWYEVAGANNPVARQSRFTCNLLPDQPGSTEPLELLLLAYAQGRKDEQLGELKANDPQVSHLAAFAQFAQALGSAAAGHHQANGPAVPPPKPDPMQSIVDMLKKKPPVPEPPKPELPPAPVQDPEQSMSDFDREMAELDGFLNDARSKAGGL